MQKQKTIAKWLAVILLVTVAVACYVVLSAILPQSQNTQNSPIAGAQDSLQKPSQDSLQSTIQPIYSTFPRKSEKVKNLTVSHVGGDGNDSILHATYCFSKTLIFFSSNSTQYDVKEPGVYLAIFDNSTLEKTMLIAPYSHTLLSTTQTRQGLIVATSDKQKTTLTLYDESFSPTCQNTVGATQSIYFVQNNNRLNALVYDGENLKCASVDNALNLTYSNYILKAKDLSVKHVINLGAENLIFCDSQDGVICAIYSRNNGFTIRFFSNKHTLVQILPIVASAQQHFLLLTKSGENHSVFLLSSSLEKQAEYPLNNVKNACLFHGQSGIEIITDNKLLKLCSHLDFISETPLVFCDENGNNLSVNTKDFSAYLQIDGYSDFLVFQGEKYNVLYRKSNEKLQEILRFSSGKALHFSTKTDNEKSYLNMMFDSTNANSFSYMCFGKKDVFSILLLTSDFE